MRVVLLAEVPHFIPLIAGWMFEEWWKNPPSNTVETVIARLGECLNTDRIDMTFVCLEGSGPIGTASLIQCDMDTRRDLSPWLASLYVDPKQRGRGAGKLLVRSVLRHANRIGFSEIHLYTVNAAAFYRSLGWQEISREFYEGKPAVIFRKATGHAGHADSA